MKIKGLRRGKEESCNPYLNAVLRIKKKFPLLWAEDLFDASVDERTKRWNELDKHLDNLRDKYSWAVPDKKCLRIVSNFSPLVEIGSGKGYWCKQLRDMGVDITAYDKCVNSTNSKTWTTVKAGGPEVLRENENRTRNLFLCFPDEVESIAIACLDVFDGEYIIHVGELMISNFGTFGGSPQAPFGMTSSS